MRLILPERYVEDKGRILSPDERDIAAGEVTYIMDIKQRYCAAHCENSGYRPGRWGRT